MRFPKIISLRKRYFGNQIINKKMPEINRRYRVLVYGDWVEATFKMIPHLKVPVFVYDSGDFEFPEIVTEYELVENEKEG